MRHREERCRILIGFDCSLLFLREEHAFSVGPNIPDRGLLHWLDVGIICGSVWRSRSCRTSVVIKRYPFPVEAPSVPYGAYVELVLFLTQSILTFLHFYFLTLFLILDENQRQKLVF